MTQNKPDLRGLSMLILDDDVRVLRAAERALEDFGATVYVATQAQEAVELLSRKRIHIVVASLNLADERFIGIVKDYKSNYADSFFYILTEQEYESIEPSLESVKMVVDDYIPKPLAPERFARMVETSTGRPGTGSTSLAVIEPLVAKTKPYFVFRSPAMRRALAGISVIATSGQNVLISGETGTGKELVARAVHVLSPRADGPFVPVNCGAIPESLIEGELFGHEKGAFTGAYATRKGKFEMANNGTLFLDEIGDMPLLLQMRLLRVLEEGNVFRVGGENPVRISVRVIAATRVDLEKAVRDGLFREDLYYRLNVLRINLPPLRDRVEDIPLLAVHFLDRAFAEMGRVPPYPSLSSETIYLLEGFPWKGNVRELRNIMTRVATLLPPDTKRIFPFHMQPHLGDVGELQRFPVPDRGAGGIVLRQGISLDEAEEVLINEALNQTRGNRTKAAKLLGISLRTLRRKLNKT
ncbi:MAG: sigma-54 dependent transcriptional regulator [Nitrospiraceae bacterium]|nr:sigma-54 dependent transcriptional regulator [Nitrospiraceae bacterium]